MDTKKFKVYFTKMHLLISAINSGLVTIFTSLAMTKINLGYILFVKWCPNWLISWCIVFCYVAFVAPQVSNKLRNIVNLPSI